MKKLILLALPILLLCSCKKNKDVTALPQKADNLVSWCNALKPTPSMLQSQQRAADIRTAKGLRRASANQRTSTILSPVLFIDFDGDTISDSAWTIYNGYHSFTCTASQSTQAERDAIVADIEDMYAIFQPNLIITTDSTVYWSAQSVYRQRLVVFNTSSIPSSTWMGSSTGVAFIGSFGDAPFGGTEPECFVHDSSQFVGFGTATYEAVVAEGGAHELGHTLGLQHQSTYNGSCVMTSEYRAATGTDSANYVPIMGQCGTANLNTFTVGVNKLSCTNVIHEYDTIAKLFPIRTDDVIATLSAHDSISAPSGDLSEWLETSTDEDVYNISNPNKVAFTLHVEAAPTTDINYSGLDIAVDYYNSSGTLLGTLDPAHQTFVKQHFNALSSIHYIKIRNTTTNTDVPANSLRGRYHLYLTSI